MVISHVLCPSLTLLSTSGPEVDQCPSHRLLWINAEMALQKQILSVICYLHMLPAFPRVTIILVIQMIWRGLHIISHHIL